MRVQCVGLLSPRAYPCKNKGIFHEKKYMPNVTEKSSTYYSSYFILPKIFIVHFKKRSKNLLKSENGFKELS